MSMFSLSLNERQLQFLSSLLPKGYSLTKFKGGHRQSKQLDLFSISKHDESLSKGSLKSHSQEEDFNYPVEKQMKRKTKLKREIQKSTEKTNVNMKSQKKQNSKKNIEKVKTLNRILDEIQKKKSAAIFIEPVDPIKLQIPHYFDIIKQPMDIMTMKRKAIENRYETFSQFQNDLKKIASNCLKFNTGNKFFVQTTEKFSNQSTKILDKYRYKIGDLFKDQSKNTFETSQRIEPNSQEETNSEESKFEKKKIKRNQKTCSKKQNQKKKIAGINQAQKKQQQKDIQENQIKCQKSIEKKSKQESIQNETDSEQSLEKDSSFDSKQYKSAADGDNLSQKSSKIDTERKEPQKKQRKGKKVKKYSYDDRLGIITRIKRLDRLTMVELFKAIRFQKGSALDFKVLEDEKIRQIDNELKRFEAIYQEKVRLQEEENKIARDKLKQDFEIAEDKDYED